MRELENRLMKHIDLLVERYPSLESVKDDIIAAYLLMEECYENGGKLLVAGNGGSAADAEHIVGELMKGFKSRNRLLQKSLLRRTTNWALFLLKICRGHFRRLRWTDIRHSLRRT